MLNKIISFLIITTMMSGFLVPCVKAETNDISSLQTEEAYNFSSILHSSDLTKEILADDVVFMTSNNKCFINNEKHDYKEFSSSPFIDENQILFVPPDIIEAAFGFEVKSDGTNIIFDGKYKLTSGSSECVADTESIMLDAAVVLKNGIFFVPIESFCADALGKYVYSDDRGYLLVSDKVRNYKNEYSEIWEATDSIHRYMHYTRPDGDSIYNSIKNRELLGKHPKLTATKEEFQTLANKLTSDTNSMGIFKRYLNSADEKLEQPLSVYTTDSSTWAEAIVGAGTLIKSLGMAYQFSGEEKYAERARLELENILSWEDWYFSRNPLQTATAVTYIVTGYDLIYEYLEADYPDTIKLFTKRFQELYLDPAVGACTGESKFTIHDSRYTHSNWGAVCGEAMLSAALILIDEEEENSLLTQKCKFLASQIIQSMEFPLGNLFPAGTTAEGFLYWDYYFSSLTRSADMLIRVCGDDYGCLSAPGFDKSAEFGIYGQTPLGCWPYSDTDENLSVYFPTTMFLYAKITNNYEMMQSLEAIRNEYGVSGSISYLMWSDIEDNEAKISYPLDYYTSGEEISIMKSSWTDKNGLYLGSIGGMNTQTMSHFDKGSFIFDALGERWFIDLGRDNYDITDGGSYWDIDVRKKLYRIRTEGHNCLVINPSSDDFGQEIEKRAKVIRNESKDRGSISVYDLTEVYGSRTNGYKRGFYLCDDRNALMIQDELKLPQSSEIYWFLHTRADIEIASDGKSALFAQNGKKLKLEIYTNLENWSLSVMDAEPLSEDTAAEGEYSRQGIQKLALSSKDALGDVTICAKLIPCDDYIYQKPLEFKPISEWIIPDGKLNRVKFTSSKVFKDMQTFDDMSDEYASQTKDNYDSSLISAFAEDFGWTLTGQNVFLKRTTGKSGQNGDYALEVKPFGYSNETAKIKLNSWNKKVTDGKVFIEYDWSLFPFWTEQNKDGVSLTMHGLPTIFNHGGLKLSNEKTIYDTDFSPDNEEWVNMRYEYDVDNNTCSLWINNVKYWDNAECRHSSSNNLSQLAFAPWFAANYNYYTEQGASKFSLDNFSAYELSEREVNIPAGFDIKPESVDVKFKENNAYTLDIGFANESGNVAASKLILAYYDETESILLGTNITDETVTSEGLTSRKELSYPDGTEYIKIMLWDNTSVLQPLTCAFKIKVR